MKYGIWICLTAIVVAISNYSCSNEPQPVSKFYGDTTNALLKEYALSDFNNYSELVDFIEQHRNTDTTPYIYFIDENLDTIKIMVLVPVDYYFGRNNSIILNEEGVYQNGYFEYQDSLGSIMKLSLIHI